MSFQEFIFYSPKNVICVLGISCEGTENFKWALICTV